MKRKFQYLLDTKYVKFISGTKLRGSGDDNAESRGTDTTTEGYVQVLDKHLQPLISPNKHVIGGFLIRN